MSKVDQAWNIFSQLMRNYPLWPSTFSTCKCGREFGRGAGPCALCLKEELEKLVGDELALKACDALCSVSDVWHEIQDKLR